MIETRRFSGYRLRFLPPDQQMYQAVELRKKLEPLVPAIEAAMREPYWIPDELKHLKPMDLLMNGLQDGELFACLNGEELAGLVLLTNIRHQQSALMEAWAFPFYRQDFKHRRVVSKFAKEIIEYAFKPFGHTINDGLGLKKIKAEISRNNYPAGRAAHALGFVQTGTSPLDALFNGVPSDMVWLELLNTAYFSVAPTDVLPHVETHSNTPDSDVHDAAGASSADATVDSGASSFDSTASDNAGERSRETVTSLLANTVQLQ